MFRGIIIRIICTIGLLYHSSQLIAEYLSAKTVVNLEVRRKAIDTVPAISICFESPFIRELFNGSIVMHYHHQYKYYSRLLYNDSLELSKKTEYEERKKDAKFYLDYTLAIHFNKFNISIDDFLNKYTIDRKYISVYFDGEDKLIKDTIESVTRFKHLFYKCITYFSMIQKPFRNFHKNFKDIYILIEIPRSILKGSIYLSIHSPITLPGKNQLFA